MRICIRSRKTLLRWCICCMLPLLLIGCGAAAQNLPCEPSEPCEPCEPCESRVSRTEIPATPSPTPSPHLEARASPESQTTVSIISSPTVFRPTSTPVSWEDLHYEAYRVQAGDTLSSISRRGGSVPAVVMRYNHLTVSPQPGRELIVPRLPGKKSLLPDSYMMVVKGNTTQPWVALTLDCGGDNPRTADILDTLRAADVQVTIFLLGSSIINDPALLRQMVIDGHELANHSYTHTDFTTLTDAQIAAELRRTEEAVQRMAGPDISVRPYFRFPYGAYDRRVLRSVIANGYLPVHWTLDALDAFGEPKTPEFLAERITSHLPPDELPGAIILAHCMGSTADALPEVLERFDAAGIEIRTLSDVLGR